MDLYEIASAYEEIDRFFEVLNNWYIRRSRQRFWKAEHDTDKQQAYNTLYSVLVTMCKASAPLIPLIAERIYLGLVHNDQFKTENSVHLCLFPDVSSLSSEVDLSYQMDKVREVCSAALSIRSSENIRTRMPLSSLTIYGNNLDYLYDFADIIHDEINVKELFISDDLSLHANFKLKINFPLLGKRLPNKIKDIIAANKQGLWQELDGVVTIAGEVLEKEEFQLILEAKNKSGSQELSDNKALCVLDLKFTAQLEAEGLARDLIRVIQQARKDSEFNVSDHIRLAIEIDDNSQAMLKNFIQFINEQTLANVMFTKVNDEGYTHVLTREMEDLTVKLGMSVI
jgi:isoleucyl-tRNA synthetase